MLLGEERRASGGGYRRLSALIVPPSPCADGAGPAPVFQPGTPACFFSGGFPSLQTGDDLDGPQRWRQMFCRADMWAPTNGTTPFLFKNVCLAVIKRRCHRGRPGPRTLLLLHASSRPQGGGPGRGSLPPKIPTTNQPFKPVLEEIVSDSARCPSLPADLLSASFFFCPFYYRDFKRQIWPTG